MKEAFLMAKATEEEHQLWRLRLHEIEENGISVAEWCREHNIPESTGGYWKRKLKKEAAAESGPCWLKVDQTHSQSSVSRLQIPSDTEAATGVIALKYAGFSIELPAHSNTKQVFEMLQVLRTL